MDRILDRVERLKARQEFAEAPRTDSTAGTEAAMPEALIPIFLFASIAAVAIFRPLTKRIGIAVERAYEERTSAPDRQIERLTQLMERLVDRMDQLEDRLDFTERVLQRERATATLTTGGASHHSEAVADEGGSARRDSLSSL